MLGIIIGIVLSLGFIKLVDLLKSKNIKLIWWQWIIVVFWFLYCAFLIMMIESFINESALKAALIMGLIFGFIAVVWAVLVVRFIFKYQKSKNEQL